MEFWDICMAVIIRAVEIIFGKGRKKLPENLVSSQEMPNFAESKGNTPLTETAN